MDALPLPCSSHQPRTVVVLQPGYLPWLGYFQQVWQADVFVHYDDVQFDKHGWRNRNRIKSPSGEPCWLTVPVRHHGLNRPAILDIEIDQRSPWQRKHVGTLRQCYTRAPYTTRYLPELEELLHRRWDRLVDLNLATTGLLCRWLGIVRPMVRSSTLGIDRRDDQRLLRICQQFGADGYFSGAAGRNYLDVEPFERQGVEVCWQDYTHPLYPQLHGPFVPYLSVIDLIFNCGDESRAILTDAGVPDRPLVLA